MKKIITILFAAAVTLSLQAQNAKTNTGTQEKKSSVTHTKDQTAGASLDGKSFKISFTDKKNDMKSSAEMPKDKTVDANTSDIQMKEAAKTDYSGFDANSKVILSFSNGYIHASMFEGTGCPYRINTSGNDMHAFSARCQLNTGNRTATGMKPADAKDTKMAMDAEHKMISDPDHTDVATMPEKNPAPNTGVVKNETDKMSPTPSVENPTPPAPVTTNSNTQDLQTQTAPATQPVYYATISGVVSGNSIEGTLSWTDSSGKAIRYSFSGSAATKKEMDENREVGMK